MSINGFGFKGLRFRALGLGRNLASACWSRGIYAIIRLLHEEDEDAAGDDQGYLDDKESGPCIGII